MFFTKQKVTELEVVPVGQEYIRKILPLAKELLDIHASQEPERFNRFHKGKAETFFRNNLENGRGTLLVARENGKVVGYAFMVEHFARASSFANERYFMVLEQLLVTASRRGQGLGGRLLNLAKKLARDQGYPSLELGVWHFNDRARALFLRHGFSPRLTTMQSSL